MMTEIATRSFSGVERAAIVLLTLGDEAAAEVLKFFKADEVTQLSIAMVKLRSLDAEQIDSVVQRFFESLARHSSVAGGLDQAERLLKKIFPEEKAAAILAEVRNATSTDVWRKLASVDRALLVGYLKGEHPQTTALILSQLGPELGARLLRSLDRPIALEVINRMLALQPVQPEALGRVEDALRVEFLEAAAKAKRPDRHAGVAEIFNNFDSRTEAELMEHLARDNPASAERVRGLMFTFKDLLKLEAAAVQTLIQAADKEALSRALRTAEEAIRSLFFANMSARAVKRLEDDWEGTGQPTSREIEAAQLSIIRTAKELIAKGDIKSGRQSETDEDDF